MRKAWLPAGVLLAALLGGLPATLHAQSTTLPGVERPARVIVKLKADSPLLARRALAVTDERASRAQALGHRVGFALRTGSALSERAQVVFAEGIDSRELARRLARESDVEYAVPDQRRRRLVAPDDPLYLAGPVATGPAAGQWYLRAPTATFRSSLDIERAWEVTTGSASVAVAVLDTGVRFDHPDLRSVASGGNLLPGYDMVSDPDFANDGDGRDADPSDPGDWVTAAEANDARGPFYECTFFDLDSGEYVATDSSWHGTKISGLIAALTNNATGMAGIGPNLRVLPVRVLGKCGVGFDSDIIAGMRWAAGLPVAGAPANPNRARVINLSLGGEGECTAAYRDVIAEVNAIGVAVVAAAGNSTGHAVSVPANCDGAIAVGALRHAGTKVGFSDLGPEIAIGAPGGNCVNIAPGSPCLYPILTTTNSGLTTPGTPSWSDSYDATLGTSFAAPLVAGTLGLVFSAQPALTPRQARLVLQSTARPFPTSGADNGDGTPVPPCKPPQYDSFGDPIDQLQCYCTIDTCGAGMLDAGAAVLAAQSGTPPPAVQAQGLWWHLPEGSEPGWGINFAHQGNVIFATWFTYDPSGKAWWLSMTATRTGASADTYAGTLIETRGPPFSAVPFDPSRVTRTVVGTGTLAFADVNRAMFAYVVNGVAQTKALTRQVFGLLPRCSYGAAPQFATAANVSDLWWVAGGAESGWGINLAHQGDNIFATWFTYAQDGTPMWLSVTAAKSAPGAYRGDLIRTAGPPFSAVPFEPSRVTRTVVGTATLTFANGNAATLETTVDGIAQTKSIVRQLFAPPAGTLCQ
jgi:serine protease